MGKRTDYYCGEIRIRGKELFNKRKRPIGVTTIGQSVDKDKIGSIPYYAHHAKLKMNVKKETIEVLQENLYEFLYNLGEGNVFVIQNPEVIHAS